MNTKAYATSGVRVLLGLALLVAASTEVRGQSPRRVSVHFDIADAHFALRLGAQKPAVETRLAQVVAEQLGRRIGFVRFVPGGQEEYALRFSLDRREPGANSLVDRGVWVKLRHESEDTAAYWFTLREAGSLQLVASGDELVRELEDRLRREDTGTVRALLARVPIAEEALFLTNPRGWALPLVRDSVCISDQSMLRFVNVERVDLVKQHRPYDARVAGVVAGDPGPANRRFFRGIVGKASEPVNTGKVRAVFVVDYQHERNCGRPLAPPPTGGGAP